MAREQSQEKGRSSEGKKAMNDIFSDDDTQAPPVKGKTALAPTFEEALAQLGTREQAFVRHVVAGKNYIESYTASSDVAITHATARVNGQKLAARKPVAHAIALGKKSGAVQAIAAIAYDLKAAHAELEQKIAAAEKAGQFTAVSSLVQQKLKLHGLLIDRAQIEQASLVVHIEGVDTSRLVNPTEGRDDGNK
jgi:hypothetical protein